MNGVFLGGLSTSLIICFLDDYYCLSGFEFFLRFGRSFWCAAVFRFCVVGVVLCDFDLIAGLLVALGCCMFNDWISWYVGFFL
jgi:hypothetical protein